MLTWMFLPFRRYADFAGRSRRKEYWQFTLLNLAVYAGCVATMRAGGFEYDPLNAPAIVPALPPAYGPLVQIGAGALALWLLVAFVPILAVTIRRLHDRGISAWFTLLFAALSLIPVVGVLASAVMLIVLCRPGTPATNQYGPDPRADDHRVPDTAAP